MPGRLALKATRPVGHLCRALLVGILAMTALVGCVELRAPEDAEGASAALDPGDPTPGAATETPRALVPTGDHTRPAVGWLAYIGGDGNVYVTTGDRGSTIRITSDATAGPEESGLSYHRLAWSRDNQLALAAVTRSGNRASGKLYVVGPIGAPDSAGSAKPLTPRLVAEDDEHFIIYSFWSPADYTNCGPGGVCGRLGYLIEETDGVGLHLLDYDHAEVTDHLVETGRPFYFSWSPDGRYLLWHAGGAARHNPEAEVGLLDVTDPRGHDKAVSRQPLSNPGLFDAPAWAPDQRHWLAVAANGDTDRLLRYAASGDPGTVLTRAPDRRIAFAWSPDGSRVAYAVQERRDDAFYGPVHFWQSRGNVQMGEAGALTNPAFDVAAFFWSPDGRRLAYLSRLVLPDEVWFQWRVYDLDRRVDRGFTAFHPTPLMQFMIHSFNQYAQSHSVWSPDGRFLVYADRDRRLTDRVWLVDTWAPAVDGRTEPILVGEGSLGVWSWGQAAP